MHPTTEKSSWLITLSKVISNFFNPLVSLLIYFWYYSSEHYSISEAWSRLLPILLILVLPVIAWITWNVKTGKYTNMDVSNRKQRNSLYVIIIILSAAYLLYEYYFLEIFDLSIFLLAMLLILMQISNFFIKSSMHTALNIYVAALFFKLNPYIGIFWLLLSIIIGITRIILKRHTKAEVIAGASIALVISIIYIFI
ncbi:phosphatase PAP2 family protein [Chryseobacterium sp. T1]